MSAPKSIGFEDDGYWWIDELVMQKPESVVIVRAIGCFYGGFARVTGLVGERGFEAHFG